MTTAAIHSDQQQQPGCAIATMLTIFGAIFFFLIYFIRLFFVPFLLDMYISIALLTTFNIHSVQYFGHLCIVVGWCVFFLFYHRLFHLQSRLEKGIVRKLNKVKAMGR